MNWKLIIPLSFIGVLVGMAGVFVISARFEALLATPLFLGCGWVMGRYAARRHFLHGFITGIISTFWTTGVRVVMSAQYLQHHPKDATQYAKMAAESGGSVVQVMVLLGLVMSLFSGVMVGSFALVANKFVRILGGER